jgi:hypothetical protein
MRTKAKNPAFPLISDEGYVINAGLTKREYFALMAMQGIIANKSAHKKTIEMITESAVRLSDDLIEKLGKTK